ncbi:MAG: polyribonucleotide nucleotidyltransferase [candidate division WOR-3 bacterium]|nr:polyribonucleotide nucleotidyltransferase [candidate division WOR-3 bacterium]MDH5683320.1 polyribonucleotide nucleotidyltransferase [candidate division WOR-3 bacterium]
MHRLEITVSGRVLSIETGLVARQASGGVLVRYGDTVVLTSAVCKKEVGEWSDFFPLVVDYRELAYAAGKIPGGFFKREGKPRDKEILSSRLIDRPIRPFFPKNFRNETQITSFLLSSDLENESDVLGIVGASAALTISEIPFQGPIGAVRIGKIDGEFVVNPLLSDLEKAVLQLVICGTKDSIIMLEGTAHEASVEDLKQALKTAQPEIIKIIEFQEELQRVASKPKLVVPDELVPKDLENEVREKTTAAIISANNITDREERNDTLYDIADRTVKELEEKYPDCRGPVFEVLDSIAQADTRRRILEEKKRLDGREIEEIRPISCAIGVLPRTHGSALFTRGQTQCLAVTTLGTKSDEQIVDDVEIEKSKSFMLHYNFPPFATGEVKPLRGPSRREIGHGALAERSLEPLLPNEESFPYTIRVVSDILESNGSSSMATVSGSSLSLMDAGVPIKAPAAGIAMGLVKENNQYVILTDIIGAEDHYGDMDFKVAGTKQGITGIQLDIKISGIPIEILTEALTQGFNAYHQILDIMAKTIDRPRQSISQYAPKIIAFKIPVDKIGEVIGPGGKMIRKIIEETGVEIDIEDDGKVTISAPSTDALEAGRARVASIVQEVEVGKFYLGKVKRITNFGAFVEVLPGKEGLLHISRMAPYRVKRVEDVVKVGDQIEVKCIGIDDLGRINLARLETKKQGENNNH